MSLNHDYKKELEELENRMIASEEFAKKLPIFAEVIRKNKLNGTEEWAKYGSKYKDICLAWDINRGFYATSNRRTITNYTGVYSGYLFNIYVNSYALFDLHNNFNLYESLKNVDIFFADTMNSTFYITDENIEPFLEALNIWYLKARKEAKIFKLREAISEAQKNILNYEKQLEVELNQ